MQPVCIRHNHDTNECFEKKRLTNRLHGVSKKIGESYHKTNKTKDTNKLSLLLFKIVAMHYNTRLTTFVQLLQTIMWNRSQNGCHTNSDGIHVFKTCTFDGRLQVGK